MTTVAKLVARSLRLIQVIDPTQAVRDADMETAIEALNAMMQRLEADLVSVGWSPVSKPGDELPFQVEVEQPIAYALAVILAPEYGVTPLPAVIQLANSGMNDLLRDQAVATPIRPILDCPMPRNWSGVTLNGESWYMG